MQTVAASSATTIGEIVRRSPRLAFVLGDAGIGPRYVAWTLEDAARDRGIRLEELLARISGAGLASVA